jgi:serine/threonine-protein kinase RsbW
MAQHNWSWTVERSLPSRCGAHLESMEEILERLKDTGWSDRELFGVQMALEESLTNAIRHGNGLDERKQVALECKLSPERFWLRVEDQGAGFIPAQVPDCTSKENIAACGGRGLMLIRAYMTSVEYNDAGNCVTMEKIRGDADTPLIDLTS